MSDALTEFQQNYPVIIDTPVHWGEMDAFQHVNNVVYFRYFESARIAYMTQTNIMSEMKEKQIGPILASTECRYRRPVTYPDSLKVGCKVTELREQDFIQEYGIFSLQQNELTTLGKARIVMVDYNTHQKTDISETIRAAIIKFQPELA